MINSFANKETRNLYETDKSAKFSNIARVALRKLIQLNEASNLRDLSVLPGNQPESLRGNRRGQHSIRINDQWRICFRWARSDCADVEICDYN